ncbi:hypothetical protein F511_41736 [Dorcoceras hygrometricum]|uniref:Uncharacterized protein n=1 Tax=Dorcoceras hygrometricum TaxID=472368 RepID=A0A2Z7D612_9LAMI|nr:hypothetical protein F511_41736 [Dorcoceras hygrometricum]
MKKITGLTNLPQSTEKRRVLETPVGARHKCQTGDLLNTLLVSEPWLPGSDHTNLAILCLTLIFQIEESKLGTTAHGRVAAACDGAPPPLLARTRARDLRAGRAREAVDGRRCAHEHARSSRIAGGAASRVDVRRRQVLRGVGWAMNAGRMLVARLPREERPRDAASGAKRCASMRAARSTMMRPLLRYCRVNCATMGGRGAAAGRRWCALAAQASRRSLRALACGVARCRRVFMVVDAAAGRPPLRRVSDDVVTAGLNSFRV